MAITKVIEIDVDELKAVGGIDKLNTAIESTEKSTKSLRTQLREAQLEVALLSEKFGATSNEAINAAKNAAILKDKIGDAKALTDAYNPDAKFKALSGALVGVAGAFSAVQGALATFGVESENVEKTLLKVNAAMALAQGLQAVGESIDSFETLGKQASKAFASIKAGIGSTGIGLLVIALGTVVAYWDEISAAVNHTTKETERLKLEQESLNKAYEDSTVKQAAKDVLELGNSLELAKSGVISKDAALTQYNETLGKSWGAAKNLDEAEQMLTKNADAYIRATLLKAAANLALDKAAQDMLKAEQARQKKLEDFNNVFLDAPPNIRSEEAYKNYTKRVTDQRKKRQQEEIKISENSAKQQTDIAKKFLKDSQNLQTQFNFKLPTKGAKAPTATKPKKEGKTDAQKQADKDAEELKKNREAIKKIEEEHQKNIDEIKADSDRKKLELQKTQALKELEIIKLKGVKEKDIEKEKAEAKKKINEEYALKFAELDKKQKEEQLKSDAEYSQKILALIQQDLNNQSASVYQKIALANQQAEAIRNATYVTEAERTKAEAENAALRASLNEQEYQNKKDLAYQGLDVISKVFEENKGIMMAVFILQKAMAIGDIVRGASKSIAEQTAAYGAANMKAVALSPLTSGFPMIATNTAAFAKGVAMTKISAGLGIASILAQSFGQIKGMSGGGGGAAGGGGGGGAAPAQAPTPTFNVAGNAGVNQIAQTIAGQQPVKAYVVAKEVTTQQELDRNKISATRI